MAGNDAFTVSLLHMDEDDQSTTFTDDAAAGSGHNWTAVNQAQIDTAQKKFGSSSGIFDGAADAITTPSSSDYDFGTGDFTIDFQLRYNADPSTTLRLFSVGHYQAGIALYHQSSTNLRLYINNTYDDFAWNPAVDTWYHMAITRNGADLRMFIDGTQIGSTQVSEHDIQVSSDTTFGYWTGFSDSSFNGWFDEIRISNVARWTSNFTAPTEAYSVPAIEVDISDSITISENIKTLNPLITITISDTITITDTIDQASIVNYRLVSDTITVTENIDVKLPVLTLSVSDSISVSEYLMLYRIALDINLDLPSFYRRLELVSDVSIGVPGASGFGVGVCPALPDGFSVLPGTMDKTSDNYGNYQYSDDSIMVWIPKFYYKVGTGANGLAVNVIDVRDAYYYASRAEAEADGYALHRAFIDGGVVKDGFFIDKYKCSNNVGIASSIKDGDPISTASVHNPISGLDACTGNYYYEAINAAGGRGANFSVTSRFMRSALAMLSMAHGQAASDAANCAWYDAAGITNFPKGLNNNRTPVEGVISNADCNDSTITYISDGYSNCGKTGSGLPFARTTHNGQASGVADLNGLGYEIDLGITRDSGNTGFYMLKEAVALKDLTSGLNGANDAWGDAAHLEGLYDTITIPCITGNDGWIKFGNGENQVLSEAISGDGFRLSALGIPEESAGLSAGGTNLFGVDGLYRYLRSNLCLISGGYWDNASYAGVWYAFWGRSRTSADSSVGFRAACYLE